MDPSQDVRTWARATAAVLCERGKAAGREPDMAALRKELRSRTEDSRARDPLYAFALCPDGFDSALALLEVDLIHPDDVVPRITLDWVAERFSARDFGPPRISWHDLPAGPAVRIRQNFAADDPPREGPGILLETLTYGVLPTGTESAVVLLASWTMPGIGDVLEAAADHIARTLVVES
ncbi:hypothetical protein QQY24_13165 [Streptomyces sp. TG1A-8]|uniref:hypothetical protein n=1 Tax=Streptomyces sp. TG1A-8 TaxID=3051385 RepID=UPI00265C78DF|nr:hypothetical protein [Streptomyces sp. TG1A-8]MDO0926327.1 hypothetical protein [Streptomyces sp. TG1A-8]